MVRWVVHGHERHIWNVICMMLQCILQIRTNFLVHLPYSTCLWILDLRNCVFAFFIIIPIINVIWWIPKLHFLMTLKGYASKCNAGTLFCALNDHFIPTSRNSDLHNGFSYVSCQIYIRGEPWSCLELPFVPQSRLNSNTVVSIGLAQKVFNFLCLLDNCHWPDASSSPFM